ncbi:hypothetical protein ABT084_18440 [Streptomyces sp. NPDC002138]|uniref:hypothetical protein n=1 Tax=Streptomyces sp. NPDC002138 TaxID=3154410 RepID=UPI00332F1B43
MSIDKSWPEIHEQEFTQHSLNTTPGTGASGNETWPHAAHREPLTGIGRRLPPCPQFIRNRRLSTTSGIGRPSALR